MRHIVRMEVITVSEKKEKYVPRKKYNIINRYIHDDPEERMEALKKIWINLAYNLHYKKQLKGK